MNDIDSRKQYTRGKVAKALSCLTIGWGELPQRVKEAHSELLGCSDKDEFKHQFDVIETVLQTVKAGDYSKITREDFYIVASTIEEMGCINARKTP